ncbi:Hsp70 family protein [Dactylosporangium salmoneum]|uniref:Hsp70 protein n=1 Tax=Dactylosporangium salmoneum TaxID=53361 RepID=A0ABP5TZ66_9ACTN
MVSPAPGGYVVGIDLGTSNTVAVIRSPDGRRRPVLFDGAPLMPSNVFLQDNGQLAVGRDAARLAQLDPGRYEPNPKRRIDEPSVLLGSAEVPTVHMLAAVLRAVAVGVAEITRFAPPVVLTYPASWGQTRRKMLHDAALAAGWQDVSMIQEPVAAARYFISALNHPLPQGEAVVVYDFGGGTIDIAVVRNEPQGFAVIGSGGLEDVGGLDLDAALVDLLGGVLQTSEPAVWRRLQDPRTAQDRRDRRLFWEDVRGAKEMLSRTTVAPVSVPGVEAAMHLTREELESRIGPMIARTVAETARVVRESGLEPRSLAGILLVGGSSRVPLVARMLHRELQVVPTVLEQPELPVAEGAVVHPSELVSSFTGTASVSAPRPPVMTGPPAAYGTESMPVPVSAAPMSGIPVSVAPVSAVPVSASPVSAAPVSPAVGHAEEPAPASSKAALIAGIAVVLLVIAGGIFALKTYNGGGGDAPKPIGQWAKLPDLPGVPLEGAGAAIVSDSKLFVIGGLSAVAPRPQLNTVYVYDIENKTWGKGPDLPEPLSHMAVVADPNQAIWVLGGLTSKGATDKVWKLPVGATRWEEGPALPKPRNSGAAIYDGGGIVYAGGTQPDRDSADTIWALGGKGWDQIGQLSDKREKLAAATDAAGTIWFLGGIQQANGNRTKDTVDMLLQHKVVINPTLKLDQPREGAVAANLTGVGLCTLGGNQGSTVYDWWCQDAAKTPLLPKLDVPRSGMAMALSGGVMYVVGGYNGTKHLDGTSTVEAFKYTG